MSLWRQMVRGIRVLFNRTAADRDIADEVEHYLEETAASLEASGLSPEDARRMARQELGGATLVRERVREQGWENVVETVLADLRYGARRLRRTPVFAVVGVLTLALGIGAATTIFSAVNPILFQSLPYPDAGDLMMIWDRQAGNRGDVTFGTYRELIERNRSFESMAVMRPAQATLTGAAEPERLEGQYVSADYFRVLGVRPAIGRDFQLSDDQPNTPLVLIISDGLWRRRFGGDSAIVGRQITIADTPVIVIGVMPRDFENVLSPSAEIWSTLRYDPALPLNGREWGHHLRMIGRVRHGVRTDQAAEELDTIARLAQPAYPRPSWAALPNGFIAAPLQDDLTRTIKPVLYAVLGAVTLLLAIACVNVTNLLLARGAEFRAELAVRAALGASRSRLVRQLLAETLLLAALGGVLGMALTRVAVETVRALIPPEMPRIGAIQVDAFALLFTLALTTLIGLGIGIFPALHGLRANVYSAVQQRSMRIAGGNQFTRRTLVVVQVALAVVLLVGAGLILRSLQQLFAVPLGFNPENLLTMQVQTYGKQFRDADTTHRFFAQALEAVEQVPGVSAAAFSSQLPLSGNEDIWGVHFESIPPLAVEENRDGHRYAVSPGYFEAMGIQLLAGRVLDWRDTRDAPWAAVINEAFAARRLPGLDPIGQRVHIGPNSGPWFTVVGVVADVKQRSLDAKAADAIYVRAEQWAFADNNRWLVVRAHDDAAALTPAIRNAIRSVNKDQPVVRVGTMEARLAASQAARRFALVLFEAFGFVALALSAIGTYSLLAGSVTERTREIGVRSALGASRQSILALVLRQGMSLAGLGMILGVAGALIASRAVVSLLFGISRLDFTTYLGVVVLLATVSVIACGIPAWRAVRISPSVALRCE
jgi:putative ABC transport system permease protein